MRALTPLVATALVACGGVIGGGRSGMPGASPSPSVSPSPSPSSSASPSPSPTPSPSTEPPQPGTFDVTMTAKETAGVGVRRFPVSAVVPLPYGRLQDTSALRVTNDAGQSVPAQLEVLNRHWAKDGSIRHVLVHFEADLDAFDGAGTGLARYHLKDDGQAIAHVSPVRVSDGADAIELDTGALRVRVRRQGFGVETPAGPLDLSFIDRDAARHALFDRSNVSVVVEESGPLRAVVRAESLGEWGEHPTPGWALRLYAYAGQSFLKVDVQLQNGAKNVVHAGPLYFEGLELLVPTSRAQARANVRSQRVTGDPSRLPLGFIDAGPARAVIRNFQQTWPNGLAIDTDGTLRVELWPTWSAQDYQGRESETGLYWLNDMQATVKEVLLDFGAAPLEPLAQTFQLHPIVTLPVAWYADTQVTLDLGGAFPVRERSSREDLRRPDYSVYNRQQDTQHSWAERFGWNAFGADLSRRDAPSTTGGWPYSVSAAFLTENPADFWLAEDFAMAELNVMPEWLPGYVHAEDRARLQLSENPYGTWSWRKFDGSYGYEQIPGYLPDTGQIARPRDDQHSWVYHVEEAYYLTGNYWIRDWYRFIGQFRRTRLAQLDPYPDMSARALGHSLGQVMQAYRVLGDPELLGLFHDYVVRHIVPDIDAMSGGRKPLESAGSSYPAEAVFQLGYLSRALIDYLVELPGADAEVEAVVGGFVRWNMQHANFSYYLPYNQFSPSSDPTSTTFCDAQAWWAMRAADRGAYEHLRSYVTSGIGGGPRPYGALPGWVGDFNGRVVKALFDRGGP